MERGESARYGWSNTIKAEQWRKCDIIDHFLPLPLNLLDSATAPVTDNIATSVLASHHLFPLFLC